MWLLLLGLALLTGDVLSQDSRPVVEPVRSPVSISVKNTDAPGTSPCTPDPCGPNTKCEVRRNSVAICRCIDGYVPLINTIEGCIPKCVSDDECPDDYHCVKPNCKRVCQPGACGLNAECKASNNRARCSCSSGYVGNPERNGSCSRVIPEVKVPDPLST